MNESIEHYKKIRDAFVTKDLPKQNSSEEEPDYDDESPIEEPEDEEE